MEDLCPTGLSEEQLQICQERLDGKTHNEILANHRAIDRQTRLCLCLRRSVIAFDLYYIPKAVGGHTYVK
jgi:hypothetical protein